MKLPQVRQKKASSLPPSFRVRRALGRLSRDRWLSGAEVIKNAYEFAWCCSSAVGLVVKAAIPDGESVVGMLKGRPTARTFDADYGSFVKALHGKPARHDLTNELIILNLHLRRKQNAR